MIVSSAFKKDVRLDMELCRAMFEKDPDRMLELVSEWMEANRLTTSENFLVPDYLNEMLARANSDGRQRRAVPSLVS